MGREWLSLTRKGDKQAASVMLFTIKQKASELGIDNESIDEFINTIWAESSTENFTFSEPDKEDADLGQQFDLSGQDDVASFKGLLDALNIHIKRSLKEEIAEAMNNESLIDYSYGGGKKKNGISSKERDTTQRKINFQQWVENSIINADTPILFSGGIGVKGIKDDVARFFSIYKKYIPKKYWRKTNPDGSVTGISVRSDATTLRNSYNKNMGDGKPLFYHLIYELIDLVNIKNSDFIAFCFNSIRLVHNDTANKQQYKERGEADAPVSIEDSPGLAFMPDTSTLSEEARDMILDWKMKHSEEEVSSLEDDEIMDKIRQEVMQDSNTSNIIDNLGGFYTSLFNAKSKIEVIRDILVNGVTLSAQESSSRRGKRISTDMYVSVINAMFDRYKTSLNDIGKRVKQSLEDNRTPLDIGLEIDMLNDNLVSFKYDGTEVTLDPLNENGSFDFKSKIPITETIDQFRTSSDVGQERDSLIMGIDSGNRSSIDKLVDLLVNDYFYAKEFTNGIKRSDGNYKDHQVDLSKTIGGVSMAVYELDIALRDTFHNYKDKDGNILDKDGNFLDADGGILGAGGELVQRKAGLKPRYKDGPSQAKFEDTKDKRRKILEKYILSQSGEAIKNTSILQDASKEHMKGKNSKLEYNKERMLRSGTTNLALDTLESLSDDFSEDVLAKSILASVLTGLRGDKIMCDLLGTSGVKGSPSPLSALKSYDEYLEIANKDERRVAELYVKLFNLKSSGSVNIDELKIHCLKNNYRVDKQE